MERAGSSWLRCRPVKAPTVRTVTGTRSRRTLPHLPLPPPRLGFQNRSLGLRGLRPNCVAGENDSSSSESMENWVSMPSASPYQILGVDPASCSPAQLKAAFRARVKEFHPDVCKDMKDAGVLMQRVLQAYEMLSAKQVETTKRTCIDPFEEPECEAYDLFVNEVQCIGKGCPYSCVKRAPHAFSFSTEYGTARAISQGHVDDYLVQLAVGQCPRTCIHYVTSSQRVILEDLLQSVLIAPYDLAEAALLDSLISKAIFENNRYQKPRR